MDMTDTTLTEVRTDALLRITQAVETAATLDELLLLALRELTQLFEVERGGVALLDDDGRISSIACEYPPQVVPLDLSAIADVPALQFPVRERQPLQIDDSERADKHEQAWELLRTRGIRSLLIVPLIAQDHVLGILVLGVTREQHQFRPDEIALARVLAGQLAAAIATFRLNAEAQRRNEELNTLNDIATTVTSSIDTHEVYRLVVQKLNEYFKVDAGSLLLGDDDTGDLVFVMTLEGGEEKLAGVRVPPGQGVVGHVVTTRHWEIVHDAQSDPRFYGKVSEDVGYLTRSILCVPMIVKGKVIGAIELLNKLDGQFAEEEAERLMRMAAFIGVAIQNAHLFQQVADGRDRLAATLNSTADGILMTDMHGVVLTANPTAARLFEKDEQELIGCTLEELLQGLHARAHEVIARTRSGADNPAEQGAAPVQISEIELRGSQHRFMHHLAMPVRDTAGEVYGQLAVFRDVTQEKELEQLREDYTGMLVHDLRAPLTSIMNGVMMVRRGLGGPVTEQQQELLKIAHQGSQTLLELINTMLDISKMEQGQMPLDLKPLVPYTLFDQAIERLQGSASTQRVQFEQRLAVGLPPIEADSEKIVRVLQNLLDNAIKFSPANATVTLGAYTFDVRKPLPADIPIHPPLGAGEWLMMWVQDRGPGIPRAYYERIFEKFGQVRGAKGRGTGLGLTFCKLAIEAHSGSIWVESEEGAGSVFAFALPLKSE
jgi:two-component system, NtrC family, sensor histidine kinase KinB